MLDLIWLLPTFPLLGFLSLVLTAGRLPKSIAAIIGAGSVGLSFAVAAIIAIQFLGSGEEYFVKEVWTWMSVGTFNPGFSFYLDGLSLTMMLVITGIGFLIHLYATGYMDDDPGFSRFFAYMNLFVAAMLMLVLGDNLVLLYLGWEGVGLCSYLLIGFWYTNPENGYAARKAFVVTRVGDTSMAIGLFLLFAQLGTLNIQDLMHAAEAQWAVGSGLAVAASLLILGGAVGKSAQLPLQTWLPDAMAGPTPISALIHAATMVTAGVYLVARTHILFELAPSVQLLVAWLGLITLLMAGFTALTQSDIKRILAYSTMSQIGYMFLGLGVGAWSASIFHLMTHAFFKALLFLASGTVILSLHHEQNIFKMGGMRKQLPVSFWSFLIGSLALTAFPFTSGYFSKDEILLAALEMDGPGLWLWMGGVLGAFFTGIYTFRLFFVVFFGENKGHDSEREYGGWNMSRPLFVLMVGALLAGFIGLPLDSVFGSHGEEEHHVSALMHGIMIAVPLIGIGIAYLFYYSKTFSVDKLMASPLAKNLHKFWFSGWGMDALYNWLFVYPFLWLARINKDDLVDKLYALLVELSRAAHAMIVKTQTGYLRWYALSVATGLVVILTLGVLL
ncbi:MAG TPA: NADH-quinone oxidoreductase subunit L [Gammaproteobacteria bacterium]|jgi:NADH-quinone oxidoreductase subunit L|nr:NADH-quinone oxidoreductase subunit L [Gammaproteobacteria bacterium]MDP6731779.1 NADH-quinone oxidoreductase subunit L [Gammaproteobacteria bacterium]HAJ76063.1 NADH-quinone oxidoreductase subunit L [Gammaproteobacteria bacterium]